MVKKTKAQRQAKWLYWQEMAAEVPTINSQSQLIFLLYYLCKHQNDNPWRSSAEF